MVIVCDAFAMRNYPVYVAAGQDWQTVVDRYDAPSMQRVLEVYDLSRPIEPQLLDSRAWPKSSPKKEEQPMAQEQRYLVLFGNSSAGNLHLPDVHLYTKDELMRALNEGYISVKEFVSGLPGHVNMLEEGQAAVLKFEVVVPKAKIVRKEYSIE